MEGGVLEIEGDKPKCTWYHINDGYFYIPSSSGANHLYLKCKISRCKGRATMPKNKDERTFENFKVTVSHSHDPDFHQLTLQKLRRKIMDRCSTEETPFLTIWNEETARIDAQVMTELEGRISFKSLTCSMKRARNSQQSKPPTTLHEYGVALLKSLKYLKTVRGSDFYLSMVESDEGGVSVIFGSPEFMELLPGVEELHLDGTFNVRPMKSLSFHMLTIMTMHLSIAFPVFFILMEKTNEAAYTDVFRFMKKKVPSLNPSVFITDFKSTLQDCLSKEFPGKEIVGSWFHAAMDMRRKAAELGLFHFLRESPMVKMILKMVMALPLLPSKNIANGYDVITEFALEKGVYDRMERFLQYVDRTWIKGVGSERLSVYRQEHRTINHQCSFHNSLSHLMNGAHPNVWRFTESLKMTENLKYEKYKSMLQGSDCSSKSVTNILQYPRIQQALHLLDDERTTVLDFLQKVSHNFDSIVNIELFRDGEDAIDTLDRGEDEGGQLVENVPIVVEIGDENQEESQENESLNDGDIKIGDFKMVEMDADVLEIPGQKPNSTWYHANDGYFYLLRNSDKSRLYLKCKDSKCRGRASMPVERRLLETFRITVPHSHGPDFHQLPLLELRRKILDRCSKEVTPLLTIWNEEMTKVEPHLLSALEGRFTYKSLKSSMHRARALQQLEIPPNLQEYGVALLNTKSQKTLRGSDFYLATIESADGGASVIFGSPELMELLPGVEELHLDGTFSVRQLEPPFQKMLTIMLMHMSHALPVFFILMEKNNEAAYTDVINFIKSKVPSLNPSVFITDFDKAIQKCLSKEFPGRKIVGSWFHVAMDMRKKAGELGLSHLLRESQMAKKVLKMAMTLPLLPSHKIVDGFDVIREFAFEKGVHDRMAEFLQYVDDTWIQGVGSEKLSVYKQKQRTCNHQESFHNLLRHLIRGPHPNIWRFTDALQKTENSNIEFYQSMLLGCPGGRGRSRTRMNLFLDKKIKRYTDQLDNEKTTVLEFLQIVSPSVYSYVDVELIPDGEEDVSDVFERDENHEESQGGQTLRMEMDVEITQIADSVEMEAGVQEIAGQKPNSTWYHINDGYFYTMSTTDKSRVYLRCRENKCKGRASMPVGNRSLETFKVTVPHIHDPDFFQLPILELRRKIMDRCSKEPTPFLTIWNEESAKIDSQLMTEIADRISYKSLKSAMHRARASKNVRVTPPTLLEFGEAVKKSPKFRKTVRGSDFYLATVESAEGGVSVILGSPEFVLLLPEVEELHLDGTFDVPPMEPPAHLLTIMLTIKSHAFPVFFILMEKNNEAAYNDVFEFIKEKVPSLNPSVFITNFDRAIQDCLSNQFPGKEIVGSWFHAAMDMRKAAGRFGLGNLLKDSPFAKTVLKMGMALPLLPSRKIANGFNVITRFAVESGVYDRMERFLQYLESAWIKAVGPEKLSVYRQKERTIIMDHQESFHHSLRDLMTKGFKPNIWSFTESIRMTENLNFEKYQSMLHDTPSGRTQSQRNLMQDKRVKCVMDQLDDGEATVLEFLQKTSNCIDDIINVENISVKEEVEEEKQEEGVTEVTKTDENDVEVGGEGEHFLASENTLMNDAVAEIEETIEEADFAVNMLQGMNERPDEVYIVYM